MPMLERDAKIDISYHDTTRYRAGLPLETPVPERAAKTYHELKLSSGLLQYIATAGHLTVTAPHGTPKASIFYVAYTLEETSQHKRPVTFLYNGGPGSASIWLHLGSWGPKRIVTGVPDQSVTSFPLIDTPDTLLTQTDLVFVDAPGTGYSASIAPTSLDTIFGRYDAPIFRDFIARYVEVNERQDAPLYLYGESFGGYRSGVLANLMEEAGLDLAGVILNSPYLNPDVSVPVPTCAMVAAYHGLSHKPDATSLADYRHEACIFTREAILPAVEAYNDEGVPLAPELVQQIADYTGLSVRHVEMSHYRYLAATQQSHLKAGHVLDLADGRMFMRNFEIDKAFFAAQESYFTDFLKYTSDTPYSFTKEAWPGHDSTYAFKEERKQPDAILDLALALLRNSKLKILALCGYYDLTTPFFNTQLQLGRLGSLPNVKIRYFDGGHMTYLTEAARGPMRAELQKFYQSE